MSGIYRSLAFAAAIAALSACAAPAPPDQRLAGPSVTDLNRMASPPNTPALIASDPATIDAAARAAEGLSRADLSEVRGLRYLEISAIPYLRRSPEGAVFLRSSTPRAIARGAPAEQCPAAAVSDVSAASAGAAATSALSACVAQLADRGAGPDCGCRLLAIDTLLLAPRTDFIFAPGVSALLIRGSNAPAQRLIAESELDDSGGERLLLRDAAGPVADVSLVGGSATVRFRAAPEAVWSGPRRIFGYRRGRLAERITLTGPDGQKVSLLIGVERRDALAER